MWLLARFIYLDALICSLSVFPQLKRKLHECREYFIYNSLFCSKNSALCMVWPIVDTLWRNAQMPFRALTLLLCITENKKDHKDPREGYDTCCFSTIWTWSNLADSVPVCLTTIYLSCPYQLSMEPIKVWTTFRNYFYNWYGWKRTIPALGRSMSQVKRKWKKSVGLSQWESWTGVEGTRDTVM